MPAAAILLTLWAGSLWTVCFLAAPLSFAVIDDRAAAGRLAAKLFEVEAWLGFIAAGLLLVLAFRRRSVAARLGPPWLLVATAAAPLVSELVVGPLMHAARVAGDSRALALSHGFGAALFFAACFGALALIWRFNRPAG